MSFYLMFGILLVILAGVMEGLYAVPIKYTFHWKWEHIWSAGSLAALVLVAWPVTYLTVPHLGRVLRSFGFAEILTLALLGTGWGVGGIFFGLGVEAVGVAVGVSIIMGLIAVVGSVIPLLVYDPGSFSKASAQVLIAALVVMLVGIVTCGVAAGQRDTAFAHSVDFQSGSQVAASPKKLARSRSFRTGLIFCLLSGVLSPLVNIALIQGQIFRRTLTQNGVSPVAAANTVWFIVFTTGYGVSILYCVYRMIHLQSLTDLFSGNVARHWTLAAIMGVLWAGGVVVYGLGVTFMGSSSAYVAWPLLLVGAMTTGSISGVIIGEWKAAGLRPLRTMGIAMAIFATAAIMLGIANLMMAGPRAVSLRHIALLRTGGRI